MNILRRFYSTTMSYGPKYIVVYYFFEKIFCRLLCFRSSGICQFTHMDKPHFYFAFQLACLDEWKEKPLGTQNTNETENASTHAVSEMISFNIFPFQFTGVLPDVTLLTWPLHISRFWTRAKSRLYQEQMTTGDSLLIERVMVSPCFPFRLVICIFQEHAVLFLFFFTCFFCFKWMTACIEAAGPALLVFKAFPSIKWTQHWNKYGNITGLVVIK